MSNTKLYQADGTPQNHSIQHNQTNLLQNSQTMNSREEFLNYRFSPEELRVIAECESESFYYRSLPFSTGLGLAAYLGIKNGILKANLRYGPWPKVIAFGFFGYIAGRISYTRKCQEKMMALPNSRFADMLRKNLQRKNTNWAYPTHEAGAATALSLAQFQSNADTYSDEFHQPNSLNLDTSRPAYSGLDDTYTPTMDGSNDLNEDLVIPQRKNTITYDELRQKNRNEYAKSHYGLNYNQTSPTASSPVLTNPSGSLNSASAAPFTSPPLDSERRRTNLRSKLEDESFGGQKIGPKNKYGDVWSE